MVYRDLSLSLAGHAALLAALLALSATSNPVRIAEVVRPVRLVTSLELPRQAPAPARTPRPTVPATPAPPPAAAPRTAERAPRPAVEPAPPPSSAARVKPVTPVAIPKIAFPTATPAPVDRPRPATRPAGAKTDATLGDRLARRLSAPPDVKPAAAEPAAPRIASLPPPEDAAIPPHAAPVPGPAVATAAPPAGSVQPVGYFPHAWYLNALVTRVDESWTPPSDFWVNTGSIAALISFRIDRAGRISRVVLKESSGHARFDRSALAAIQRLAQVPALPEQYAEESLDVVIRMRNEK